ncbi:putative serpin-like protein, partial [Leptotrombidium deliense]
LNGRNNLNISPIVVYDCLNNFKQYANNETRKQFDHVLGSEFVNIEEKLAHLKSAKNLEFNMESKCLINNNVALKDLSSLANFQVEDFSLNRNKIVKECNEWVNDVTKGKINTIMDDINSDALVIMLGANYFYSKWETPFLTSMTKNRVFYNNGVNETFVPTMFAQDVECNFYTSNITRMTNFSKNKEIIDLDIIDIPYMNNVCMTIVKPKIVKDFFASPYD